MRVTLLMRGAHSLKEKRSVLNQLRDRLRRDFNASIAEVGSQDAWQRSDLGVAVVGTDPRFVKGLLSDVLARIRQDPRVGVVDVEEEVV